MPKSSGAFGPLLHHRACVGAFGPSLAQLRGVLFGPWQGGRRSFFSPVALASAIICNFHPSRARNATIIISKLNNFAEVLAVRVHVDVYMATTVLRSVTHDSLCDTGHDDRHHHHHHLPTTPSPNPSTLNHLYLFFLRLRRKKS